MSVIAGVMVLGIITTPVMNWGNEAQPLRVDVAAGATATAGLSQLAGSVSRLGSVGRWYPHPYLVQPGDTVPLSKEAVFDISQAVRA